MKRIIITLLAFVTLGGVASADPRRPYVRDHRSGGVFVQPSRPYFQPRYQPRYRYERPAYRYYSHHYSRPTVHIVRRPIYVQRPIIAYRYYNYYRRPAVIAENYPAMAGYYWVAGQWTWSGYEWVWQPGHYEPDPNYVDPSYDPSTYDPTYYDPNYTQPSYDGSYDNGY